MGVIVYFQTALSMGLQAYSQKAANFLQALLFCSCEIKWLFFPPYGIGLAFLNHHVHQFFHTIFSFTFYVVHWDYYIYLAIEICLSLIRSKFIAYT